MDQKLVVVQCIKTLIYNLYTTCETETEDEYNFDGEKWDTIVEELSDLLSIEGIDKLVDEMENSKNSKEIHMNMMY